MKYETPEMKVLMLKVQDVVTASDNGVGGDDLGEGGSTDVDDSDWN